MAYNYTEEAKIQLSNEWKKLSEIKNIRELDDDINKAAEKIIEVLHDEEEKINKTFKDYLERYLSKSHMIDMADAFDFIQEQQTNRVEYNGDILLDNSKIKSCLAKNGKVSRSIIFKLAFALGMNAEECEELLRKGLNERGFNFKDPKEIVSWYCLKFGYGFLYVNEILEEYEKIETEQFDNDNRVTQDIYNDFTSRFVNSNFIEEEQKSILMDCLKEIKSKYSKNIINNTVCNIRLDNKFLDILAKVRKEINYANNISYSIDREIRKDGNDEVNKEKGGWHKGKTGDTSLQDVSDYI